jgi:hypothetical protein
MSIVIHGQRTIAIVREEFNREFPYLELEFFSGVSRLGALQLLGHSEKQLDAFRTDHHNGELIITPQMKVSELEQLFNQAYGLKVRVLRQSGKSWIETILTEDWTLEDQNREGGELSQPGQHGSKAPD